MLRKLERSSRELVVGLVSPPTPMRERRNHACENVHALEPPAPEAELDMQRFSRTHLADRALLEQTLARVRRQCEDTAELLADLAEIDARQLYLTEGYDSMLRFCIGAYGFSEDMAYKRIQVARAARELPALFAAIAAGRINLSAARLLVPHLTCENVDELLAAASKSNAEIQVLLARRTPGVELEREPLLAAASAGELAVRQVGSLDLQRVTGRVAGCAAPPAASAGGAKRMELRLQVSPDAYEKLRYARELLGHAVPSGELGEVFERAVEALIEKLEKDRLAVGSRLGTRRGHGLGRYVPADVRRAVHARDGGRCTYVSPSGHRCESRMRLEFDHVTPVAQGGRSTVDGIRLLCRAHNQLAAEQKLGKQLVQTRRELAPAPSRRGARATNCRRRTSACPTGGGFDASPHEPSRRRRREGAAHSRVQAARGPRRRERGASSPSRRLRRGPPAPRAPAARAAMRTKARARLERRLAVAHRFCALAIMTTPTRPNRTSPSQAAM